MKRVQCATTRPQRGLDQRRQRVSLTEGPARPPEKTRGMAMTSVRKPAIIIATLRDCTCRCAGFLGSGGPGNMLLSVDATMPTPVQRFLGV